MRKITKLGKRNVKIRREDWNEFLRRLALGGGITSRGGDGDCGNFCGAACADNGGCSMPFGESGECGAVCNDGEVFLEGGGEV